MIIDQLDRALYFCCIIIGNGVDLYFGECIKFLFQWQPKSNNFKIIGLIFCRKFTFQKKNLATYIITLPGTFRPLPFLSIILLVCAYLFQ